MSEGNSAWTVALRIELERMKVADIRKAMRDYGTGVMYMSEMKKDELVGKLLEYMDHGDLQAALGAWKRGRS